VSSRVEPLAKTLRWLDPMRVLKPAVRTMLVPVPRTVPRDGQPHGDNVGGQPLRDTGLLAWCGEVIRSEPPGARA
jgi:hypothetical protein